MNIINVPGEIVFVTNQMFPVTALPDTPFTFSRTAPASHTAPGKSACEPGLDQHPARREIIVIRRQGPKCMKMFGEDHNGIHAKRIPAFHACHHAPEKISMICQQRPRPVCQSDGEEISAAFDSCPAILHPFNIRSCWGSLRSPQPTVTPKTSASSASSASPAVQSSLGLLRLIHSTALHRPHHELADAPLLRGVDCADELDLFADAYSNRHAVAQ